MIRVLIVDDSPLICSILTEVLNGAGDIEVVGVAGDPVDARQKIKVLKPDVLTLDVEMPKMDGITFLKNLMRLHPMPVVMISTLTEQGADVTMTALSLGAVDYLAKPTGNQGGDLSEYSLEIINKVRAAAQAKVENTRPVKRGPKMSAANLSSYSPMSNYLVAIGASTGGVEAIKQLVAEIPVNCPPIVIVQHIPPAFSKSYADRLNREFAPQIQEVGDHQEILPGNIYIAPGDFHLTLTRDGSGQLYSKLDQSERVRRHRPSVDVLFESIEKLMGGRCCAALLTGMGDDGARGLLKLKEAGAYTIIQDKATSVVWGMPGVAAKMNAHCIELSLEDITRSLMMKSSKRIA